MVQHKGIFHGIQVNRCADYNKRDTSRVSEIQSKFSERTEYEEMGRTTKTKGDIGWYRD